MIVGLILGVTLVQKPQPINSNADDVAVTGVPVYRFYNPATNLWTWSGSPQEKEALVNQGHINHGVLFLAFSSVNAPIGTVPLYTLDYHADPPQTFLTTSEAELALLMRDNDTSDNYASYWRLKDQSIYVYPPTHPSAGLTPVFRLLYNNPGNIYHGTRYYSTDQNEINNLLGTGAYVNEGIAFFGNKAGPSHQGLILRADPNPCTLNAGGTCTSNIIWGSDTNLTITIKENPGSLFAKSPKGTQDAPWITATGATFQAYSDDGVLLDELYVRGK